MMMRTWMDATLLGALLIQAGCAVTSSERTLGLDPPETARVQEDPSLRSLDIADSPSSEPTTAALLGLPASLADVDTPSVQDPENQNEFSIKVNLWPILESTRLSTGEHRTALWPLFHVTTRPKGGVYSWHVLNFLSGPQYHMLLPLYYSIDEDLGILPPAFIMGAEYWASPALLSGSWTYPDGERSTWATPLFHLTRNAQGDFKNMHVGPFVLGGDYWTIPFALSGGWAYADGVHTTWVTPLFHVTTDAHGGLANLHAGFFFEGPTDWSLPPLLTWHHLYADGMGATWVTPLFHWTTELDGRFSSTHMANYFQGRDYWTLFPLAGGGTYDDGTTTLWVTPFFHVTHDSAGAVENVLIGPYMQGRDWWSVPPLLAWSWMEGEQRQFTASLLFWLGWKATGELDYATLFPLYFWSLGEHWVIPPLFAGSWGYSDGTHVTWLTPLFHLTEDQEGAVKSLHVGPYFVGEDYWAVPPLLSWKERYPDHVEALWLTPLFHHTWAADGSSESAHLFPAVFWKRDDYWTVPPLLFAHWTSADSETLWLTPLFHRTTTPEGKVLSFHVGLYLEGETSWELPLLLTGGWDYPDGHHVTWVTPFFHLTQDETGSVESLHALVYFLGKNYWAVPPLFSWDVRYPDGVDTLWLTPLFHETWDKEGGLESVHLFPAFIWERDDYWAAPALLSAGWREADGAETTWITPLVHVTETAEGELRSFHAAPFLFWEKDSYWLSPLLLSGGGTLSDGSQSLWITPLFHDRVDPDGTIETLDVLPLWLWKRDSSWAIPPLLTGSGIHADGSRTTWITPLFHATQDKEGDSESLHVIPLYFWKRDRYWSTPLLLSAGWKETGGDDVTWLTPLYHDATDSQGALVSRHFLNYIEGPSYHHLLPIFWDWTRTEGTRTSMVPPFYVRTAEPDGAVTTSLPWPILSIRQGRDLDTSLGMELRPFVYQSAGEQMEFNVLWRLFSVLKEPDSTRVMIGPLWYSERPNKEGATASFQILGGLFARDCNHDTQRYRYRMLWVIPFRAESM